LIIQFIHQIIVTKIVSKVADIKKVLGKIFRVVGIILVIGGGFGAYLGWQAGVGRDPDIRARYDILLMGGVVILVIGIIILVVGLVLRNLVRRKG
jgi:hypothetical protein